jgi:predicted MFS family arabinose efflux permease
MTDERIQHSRAWLAAGLLAIANLICVVDKTLPSLLMEPIKHAMELSDTQIGLLTGFSLSIALSISALPIAWLADRYDRTLLLGIAIAAWCLMTIASGFAHDFTTLFLCRIGVGIGEAALIPTAMSLLPDLFPLRRIARASALIFYAGFMGSFIAMAGGGAVFEIFHAAALAGSLPLLPEDAWRWTTVLFGGAGLLVAVLILFFLPEPRRRAPRSGSSSTKEAGFAAYLRTASPFLIPFALCIGLLAITAAGFNAWLAPFLTRTYGWSIGQVGGVLGVTLLVGGLCAPATGVFFNKLARDRLGREAPVAAICTLLILALPFMAGAPLLPNGLWAAASIGIGTAMIGGCAMVGTVVYASIAPSHLRARVIAVLTLFTGLAGASGSVVYAGFTDLVLRDPAKLYLSLSLVSAVALAFSIGAGFFAHRRYQEIVAAAIAAETIPNQAPAN